MRPLKAPEAAWARHLLLEMMRDAKVGDLAVAVLSQKHVVRFQVSVGDVVEVEVAQPRCNIHEVLAGHGLLAHCTRHR